MIPGEIRIAPGVLVINASKEQTVLPVRNRSTRVIRVTSHFPFAEVNPRLEFDRDQARNKHLDIPAGATVRFAPGEEREVALVPYDGHYTVRVR